MRLPKGIFAVGTLLPPAGGLAGAAAITQQEDWSFDSCQAIRAFQEEGVTTIQGGSVTFTASIECGKLAVRLCGVAYLVHTSVGWRESHDMCGVLRRYERAQRELVPLLEWIPAYPLPSKCHASAAAGRMPTDDDFGLRRVTCVRPFPRRAHNGGMRGSKNLAHAPSLASSTQHAVPSRPHLSSSGQRQTRQHYCRSSETGLRAVFRPCLLESPAPRVNVFGLFRHGFCHASFVPRKNSNYSSEGGTRHFFREVEPTLPPVLATNLVCVLLSTRRRSASKGIP